MTLSIRAIHQMIDNAVAPLRARLRGVVRRGTLRKLDNGPGMATGSYSITDTDTDVDDAVEVLNPIGLSIRPGKGIESIIFAVGGNPAHRVALPFVRGMRLTGNDIAEGEVAVYIGQAGQAVHLKADGSLLVSSKDIGGQPGGSVLLKANGDVVVTPAAGGAVYLGDDAATKKVSLVDELNTLRSTFNSHTHPTAPVGPVSTPTPVPGVVPVPPFTGADNVFGKG